MALSSMLMAPQVKCDRGQPSCGWCIKNNSSCIYLPRKKPGLRAGYGRELEARLGEYCFLFPPCITQIRMRQPHCGNPRWAQSACWRLKHVPSSQSFSISTETEKLNSEGVG